MTFVPRPGLEEAVLRMDGLADALEPMVEAAADAYRESVPVASGRLAESIETSVALTSKGWRGRVLATDPKAALVEFGTIDHPPDGSLRRAIESIGGTFEPAPGRD